MFNPYARQRNMQFQPQRQNARLPFNPQEFLNQFANANVGDNANLKELQEVLKSNNPNEALNNFIAHNEKAGTLMQFMNMSKIKPEQYLMQMLMGNLNK